MKKSYCSTLLLIILLYSTLLGEKVALLTEIRNPRSLTVDDTQLYVTEKSTCYIYSLKNYRLMKIIGREGQGPQEFQTLPHIPIIYETEFRPYPTLVHNRKLYQLVENIDLENWELHISLIN